MADPDLSLVAAHDIATAAEHRLLHDVPRLVGATVHVSPRDTPTRPTTTCSLTIPPRRSLERSGRSDSTDRRPRSVGDSMWCRPATGGD